MSDLLARLREAVLGRQYLPSDYGDMWADIERIVAEWENSQWVSIKERLPEGEGRVQVYSPIEGCFTAWLIDGVWKQPILSRQVTHWRALPEDPKEAPRSGR